MRCVATSRSLLSLVLVSAVMLTLALRSNDACGQDNEIPATPMERIAQIHEKVKQKFRFGRPAKKMEVEKADEDSLYDELENSQATRRPLRRSSVPATPDAGMNPNLMPRRQTISPAAYQQQVLEEPQFYQGQPIGGAPPRYYRDPQRPTNQQIEINGPNAYAPGFYPAFPPPNPGYGANYRSDPGMTTPMEAYPQPAQAQAWQGQTPTVRTTGHFDNGSGVIGQQLHRGQMTATQRALKLEEENQLLRSSKESLMAENERLRTMLTKNRSLLTRIEDAIAKAREELRNVKLTNESLRQKLANLEAEKKKQAQQTAQLLNSIRRNLDDVIMSEMTEK